MEKKKGNINVVFIGHVDAGKSTTAGHLIYKRGAIEKKLFDRIENNAFRMGKPTFKYSYILSKLKIERERGITIEIARHKIETTKQHITIIDVPGHRAFLKNMITGACQADAAVLMLGSAEGEFEVGLKMGQTYEHSLLCFILGIKQLIVGVNKMDEISVNFLQSRYDEIVSVSSLFLKKIGYNVDNVPFVPLSGYTGDNLVDKSEKLFWYNGPTLLEAIDNLVEPKREIDKPLRIPIQKVFKIGGIGTVAVGRVESGILRENMKITFAPGNNNIANNNINEVHSIESEREKIKEGRPGEIVGFNIKNIGKNAIYRGMIASDATNNPARETKSFIAKVRIINHPGEIKIGYTPIIDCHTAHIACRFGEILERIGNTGKVLETQPTSIKMGETAVVKLVPKKAMCVERFRDYPQLGRFVIRDNSKVIGAGVVTSVEN